GPYRIDRITEAADLEAVSRLLASAFELPRDSLDRALPPSMLDAPGLALFLAYLEDEPVSTVMTTTTGATVGIWSMATLPERQRQGAGRATLETVIAYHCERGGQRFFLGASPAGKPLYDRIGFRVLEETPLWVAGASGETSHGPQYLSVS
ncbi:MAG: GNAT family N-acetyltransferase, partial [Chloroflexota bacterium]|nr:GNAT family N-acetyltransferase [Chloroflexota bacterium]